MLLRTYTPIWNKYRPVLLKLMVESKQQPQSYQLSAHEFKALDTRKKGSFSFALEVANGKIQNNVKDSPIAQDLWEILQLSPKANELIQETGYRFEMDKNYLLRVATLNN